MSAARALRASPRQPDPHRRRLAVSGERRVQPGRRRGGGRDGPARARRRPERDLTPDRRALGERRRRLEGRSGAAARTRRRHARASSGDSRTHASSGSTNSSAGSSPARRTDRPARPSSSPTTEDFTTVERYGVVRHPEDKNAALLPHRIDGRWVLLHRPKTQFGGGARRDPPLALGRSRQLERARASAPAAHRRLVGLAADRHRPTADPHGTRLAAHLPRRQGDDCRRHLPRRPRPARPRRADSRHSPAAHLDPRSARAVRTNRGRAERRVPVRTRP